VTDRETDCDLTAPVRSWPGMPDFAELNQQIERLCRRAIDDGPDTRLLVEIEDLLAEGYVSALRGDHCTRRLRRRLDALLEAGEEPEQIWSVAREHRAIREATDELRARLAIMREHWIALGSERLGLA
jgi:hypothetical protein